MPDANIDIKKTPPANEPLPDVWRSFRTEMDRLFDRFDAGFRWPSVRRLFDLQPFARGFEFNLPAVDVNEDDKTYKISAELPGLDEKNIEVTLTGDQLTLKGEKHQDKEEKEKNHFVSERCYGSFQRNFTLPDGVDRDKIAAKFEKGVLTVTLPKSAEARKQEKKIEVKAA